jgi:hypothetical protein
MTPSDRQIANKAVRHVEKPEEENTDGIRQRGDFAQLERTRPVEGNTTSLLNSNAYVLIT